MAKLVLLACASLFVLNGAFVRGADPCVLDGFDLQAMERGSYWNVTLTKDECLVPKGYTMKEVANCTVYFSICKPLPHYICVNHTNSSTCQVVYTKKGTVHYFDIGSYEGNREFEPTGGTGDVGFATIRQGNASNSAMCNNTFTTVMSWKCEPSSRWDHMRNNNATVFVENSFNFEACLLEMRFNYSGACYVPPTLAPGRCQLDPYDVAGLKKEDYYFVTLPNKLLNTCLPDNATSCTVYFSFCQGLPLSIADGCYEASVCQTGMSPNGEFSYNMGQIDQQTRFLDARENFATGGFHIDVEGGDTECSNTEKGISTQVVLVCDPLAIWTKQDLSNVVHVTQQEPCAYTITVLYAGACLLPASSTAHSPTATATPSPSTTGHHPSSTTSGSITPTKSHSANSTTAPSHTSQNPSPTQSRHNTKTTSGARTSSSTPGPVHSPTTGPPSHHTTPEGHHTTPEGHHTTPEHKKPTTKPTAKPDSHKIAGLTAGLVIFVLISVALLVLFLVAAFYIYKQRHQGGEYEKLTQAGD